MKVRFFSVHECILYAHTWFRVTDIPITSSDFWQNEDECTEEVLKHVFRSATEEEIPLFQERMACLREAGQVLYEVCF